jgi:hypothetical protein
MYLITNGTSLYLQYMNSSPVWTDNRDNALRMSERTAAETVTALKKYGYQCYVVGA